MIPGHAADKTDMMAVAYELRHRVKTRRQVFVSFNNDYRSIGKPNGEVKSFQSRPDNVIEISSEKVQHVEDDGRNRGFPMTSRDDDALFVERLLINVFRKGSYGNAGFLSLQKFRVVHLGVHPQDDFVDTRYDRIGKPSFALGQQPVGFQCRAGRFRSEEHTSELQ